MSFNRKEYVIASLKPSTNYGLKYTLRDMKLQGQYNHIFLNRLFGITEHTYKFPDFNLFSRNTLPPGFHVLKIPRTVLIS